MNSNNISNKALEIFKTVINQYHVLNTVDQIAINPFSEGTFDYLLYKKSKSVSSYLFFFRVLYKLSIDSLFKAILFNGKLIL